MATYLCFFFLNSPLIYHQFIESLLFFYSSSPLTSNDPTFSVYWTNSITFNEKIEKLQLCRKRITDEVRYRISYHVCGMLNSLPFLFLDIYCLSFDLWLLITPLVSSTFSFSLFIDRRQHYSCFSRFLVLIKKKMYIHISARFWFLNIVLPLCK